MRDSTDSQHRWTAAIVAAQRSDVSGSTARPTLAYRAGPQPVVTQCTISPGER